MSDVQRHGSIWLLKDEGAPLRGVRAMRGLAQLRPPQPVLVLLGYNVARDWPIKQRLGARVPGLPEVLFGATVQSELDTLVLRYTPGVFLHEVVTQTRENGAMLPTEAAVAVVVDVARAVDRYRTALGQVDQPQAAEIRVAFAGGVELLSAAWEYDDMRDPIGALPLFHAGPRREVPFDLGLRPEDLEDPEARAFVRNIIERTAAADNALDRGLVFSLGSLLHFLLATEAPFADDHPLLVVDRVRRSDRRPLPRDDVPGDIMNALDAALAVEPALRPATPAAFADLLAGTTDVEAGRKLLGDVARGLFPQAVAEQEAFLEEASFSESTEVDAPPIAPGPATIEQVRFAFEGRALRVDAHPVRHADVVAFLDETGTPDPPDFMGRLPELGTRAAVCVPWDLADAYARWRGARLPTEAEWTTAATAVAQVLRSPVTLGAVWEWTSTPVKTGHVVRGGPWRNRDEPARIDNRSWEDEGCVDVGFRCVDDDAGAVPPRPTRYTATLPVRRGRVAGDGTNEDDPAR